VLTGEKVIRKAQAMTFDRIDRTGFAPHCCERRHGHRSTAVAQLVTSAALALSLTVAAAAVSIGIARADGLVAVAQDSTTHVAAATVLALILGATAVAAAVRRSPAPVKADE
jgi:hypothetical protein